LQIEVDPKTGLVRLGRLLKARLVKPFLPVLESLLAESIRGVSPASSPNELYSFGSFFSPSREIKASKLYEITPVALVVAGFANEHQIGAIQGIKWLPFDEQFRLTRNQPGGPLRTWCMARARCRNAAGRFTVSLVDNRAQRLIASIR
jgi:hypothetical protein